MNNVSLAEIVRAAGQRNTSAIHYHFGSRDAVLQAILERHVPVIRERRMELLALAEARDDARSAAAALVRPVTEFAQRGWRERAYLQIGSELTSYLDRGGPVDPAAPARDRGSRDAGSAAPSLPADPARHLERAHRDRHRLPRASGRRPRPFPRTPRPPRPAALPDEEFVENLIDMFLGAVTSPVSVRVADRGTGG